MFWMDLQWKPITDEHYQSLLGAVPPARYIPDGFVCGEPVDASPDGTLYTVCRCVGGLCYETLATLACVDAWWEGRSEQAHSDDIQTVGQYATRAQTINHARLLSIQHSAPSFVYQHSPDRFGFRFITECSELGTLIARINALGDVAELVPA